MGARCNRIRCKQVLVVTELVVSGTQCNLVWIEKNANVIEHKCNTEFVRYVGIGLKSGELRRLWFYGVVQSDEILSSDW